MKSLPYHIFIDTNVLINDILFRRFNRLNHSPQRDSAYYFLKKDPSVFPSFFD
jgi:hypothetical protein